MSTIYHSAFGGDLVFEENESLEHSARPTQYSIAINNKSTFQTTDAQRKEKKEYDGYRQDLIDAIDRLAIEAKNAVKKWSKDDVDKMAMLTEMVVKNGPREVYKGSTDTVSRRR